MSPPFLAKGSNPDHNDFEVIDQTYFIEAILDQNYVWVLDAALNDLLFSKICFIKSNINML